MRGAESFPQTGAAVEASTGQPEELPERPVEPSRYGDWEVQGRCIDF